MVVDDARDLCDIFARLLKRYGYDTMCAYGGREAVAALAPRADGPPRVLPDLILLDVMMPDMDGLEVLRALKDDPATARVPIVMCSAVTDRRCTATALAWGAVEFWHKPMEFKGIAGRIDAVIASGKPPVDGGDGPAAG